ncbi:hypothetical protein GA829_33040 (plasmid) [Mesorhizobium sp. INR15]|nr:hypothetical protein GA829_33040 [Mesorhizobium sp. INR15]
MALLAQSNCLVVRPAGASAAEVGETVKFVRFDTTPGSVSQPGSDS